MVPLHEIYERLSSGFGVFVWAWTRKRYESQGAPNISSNARNNGLVYKTAAAPYGFRRIRNGSLDRCSYETVCQEIQFQTST
jgi:hypothetical protein